MTDNLTILTGNCLDHLRSIPDESVQTCVTSPPYWGLRGYGSVGQIGLEDTPEAYVGNLVNVFREVRRVLRRDGTLWLNLGDSYWGGGNYRGSPASLNSKQGTNRGAHGMAAIGRTSQPVTFNFTNGAKPKDLVGIPWRVAFALQADGWYLRQDIIWAKPNPMPESVTDRCTKSHEYIFLLSKSARYFYDSDAIKEPSTDAESLRPEGRRTRGEHAAQNEYRNGDEKFRYRMGLDGEGLTGKRFETRNKRSVWAVPTSPYPGSHFATFPPDLIKPCILAGCPVGGVVLDPFAGSGTTGQVALELGRRAIMIELNPAYVALIRQRCNVTPGLPLA